MSTQMDPTQQPTDQEAQAPPVPNGTNGSNGTSEPTPVTVGGGKNVVLPRDAFNARLTAAGERGKRAAVAEMEEAAKQHGFTSMQDAFATLAAIKSSRGNNGAQQPQRGGGQPQRQAKPDHSVETTVEASQEVDSRGQNGNGHQGHSFSHKEQRRYEAMVDRERKGREAERRQRLHEERRRKESDRTREAMEAEMSIREQAVFAGINGKENLNYAVSVLKQSIEGKTADELKSFDEVKFFEELRTRQPYLFGERIVPATTGTGGKEPAAPKPGETLSSTAAGNQVDASKMNDKDYRTHLRKRGLSLDVAGV